MKIFLPKFMQFWSKNDNKYNKIKLNKEYISTTKDQLPLQQTNC